MPHQQANVMFPVHAKKHSSLWSWAQVTTYSPFVLLIFVASVGYFDILLLLLPLFFILSIKIIKVAQSHNLFCAFGIERLSTQSLILQEKLFTYQKLSSVWHLAYTFSVSD